MTVDTIVLLPGLDGTGALFADFIQAIAPPLSVKVARYPTDRFLSYAELRLYLREFIPSSSPFVLVAESFSTPLAAALAATCPQNLMGLVLCAGFVMNPAGRWWTLLKLLARPLLFRISPPTFILEYFLIGSDPPTGLEASVRRTLRLVNPSVLAQRVRATMHCDAREDLARTKVPIMYIQAETDRLVGAESFSEVQRLRPDTILATIPGPHLVLQREPRKGAEAIMRFMDQVCNRLADP